MLVNKTWAIDILLEGQVVTYYLKSMAGVQCWYSDPPRQMQWWESQKIFDSVPPLPKDYEAPEYQVVNGPYLVTIEYFPEHFKITKEKK